MQIVQTAQATSASMDTPADRLKHARRDAGFSSATRAAQFFKWNENTYRSHENGKREFGRSTANKYANAYKVSANWLFLGEGQVSNRGFLSGFITDDGRVMLDRDGLDIELIGIRNEGVGLVLLVQTVDLDPRFSMNDVVLISDRELEFSDPDSHTAGDRIWCYLEAEGYRPMLAQILKVRGVDNIEITFSSSYGERILLGVPNIKELSISTGQIQTARPVRAIVTEEGWRYLVPDVTERLKTPKTA